jgi:hypothetical protein
MSDCKKGRVPPNKGKKASEEAKRNMSIAHLGKPALNKRPIIDSNGTIYSSLKDAAQKLSLKSHSAISQVLSGKCKTAKGLSFSYLDKQTNIVYERAI